MSDQTNLWQARAFDIGTLIALMGTPQQLAARGVLTRKLRDIARDWLRLIEALMRRTLFIDALALVNAIAPPRLLRRRQSKCAPDSLEPDQPAFRRIPFPLLPPRRSQTRSSAHGRRRRSLFSRRFMSAQDRYGRIKPQAASAQHAIAAAHTAIANLAARRQALPRHPLDSRRLAARLDALIRVVADPEPHAKRLAKKLIAGAVARRVLALIPRSLADQHGHAIDPLQAECLTRLTATTFADSS